MTHRRRTPPPPPGVYEAGDVLAVTGVTYRQLDHWTGLGLAEALPRPEGIKGPGTRRLYPLREVARLVVMARLVRAGMEPAVARAVAVAAVAQQVLGTATVPLAPGLVLVVDVPGVPEAGGAR